MAEPRTTSDDWRAIHDLIMTYADCVDSGNFDAASALFEHASYEVEFEIGGAPTILSHRGSAEVLAFMRQTPLFDDGTPRTRHVNTNVLIDLQGDSATSRCYFTVLQQTPTLPLQPIATGRYVDSFECVDGGWRFASRRMTDAMAGDTSQHAPAG
jgi:3-phenylpropionate/cinnamic acid dioxygenase small subunit